MLSRVAESIYWMCRNIERAENIARFIEVTHDFVLDTPEETEEQWLPLVYVTGQQESFFEQYETADSRTVTEFLVLSDEYPNSMARLIRSARENARSVRETIASEVWEQLNEFYQWFWRETQSGAIWRSPSDFLRQAMRECTLFNGFFDATMTRDLGWHFGNLGRQIERADQISRLLDVKYFTLLPNASDVNTPVDYLQWASLLRSVSGLEMYRKRHREVTVERVVSFLVLNRAFPRAILHCLTKADRSLHAITGCPSGEFSNRAEQILGRLVTDLAYTEAPSIIQQGLHEFADDLQTRLNEVGDGVFDAFFALRPVETDPEEPEEEDEEPLPAGSSSQQQQQN